MGVLVLSEQCQCFLYAPLANREVIFSDVGLCTAAAGPLDLLETENCLDAIIS